MRQGTYVTSLYRHDLFVYGGSRGQKDTFIRGRGVPRDLWHCICSIYFYHLGAAIVISSTIATGVSGSMEKVFAHEDEFPLAIFVVSGDGIEYVVDSSLSGEKPGRVLIWDFQYDSYPSVSCRFGLFGLLLGT